MIKKALIMGMIGHGYGSEWHLLRWLGRHRNELNHKIMAQMSYTNVDIEWLDFLHHSKPQARQRDLEYTGISFLQPSQSLKDKWEAFWPASGNQQNWDAIGYIQNDNDTEWLLIEAKAHIGEIKSSCGAKSPHSLGKINTSFLEVKTKLGIHVSQTTPNWLSPYYQYANRLAILHFLRQNGVKAHLVFIYFCGDTNPSGICPISQTEWLNHALQEQDQHLQLNQQHCYSSFIHKVFLQV